MHLRSSCCSRAMTNKHKTLSDFFFFCTRMPSFKQHPTISFNNYLQLSTDSKFKIPIVPERRNDSFHRIMHLRDEHASEAFPRLFNQYVFNVGNDVMGAWRYASKQQHSTDKDVYDAFQSHIASTKHKGKVKQTYQSLVQLNRNKLILSGQASRLLRETSLWSGTIESIVCVGDHGKGALAIPAALEIQPPQRIYTIPMKNSTRIRSWLELNLGEVGLFTKPHLPTASCVFDPDDTPESIDRAIDAVNDVIPTQSIDMIILFAGLHHYPQSSIHPFLSILAQKLKPCGLLLLREHDASTPDALAAADVSHMMVHAQTNVSWAIESQQRRAFRSLSEWRNIVSNVGLQDLYLLQSQATDPSLNYMVGFQKPNVVVAQTTATNKPHTAILAMSEMITSPAQPAAATFFRFPRYQVSREIQSLGHFLETTQVWYAYPFGDRVMAFWRSMAAQVMGITRAYGPLAMLNYGLINTVMNGIVFTLVYTLLLGLSLPIWLGKKFTNDKQTMLSEQVEELLLLTSPGFQLAPTFVIKASAPCLDRVAYRVHVPRQHRLFTAAMIALANSGNGGEGSGSVELVSIAGRSQDEFVHMAIVSDNAKEVAHLVEQMGDGFVVMNQAPMYGVAVRIRRVLDVLRMATTSSMQVIQVYDFL